MPTDHIVVLLIAERDKLERAIQALQGGGTEAGNPGKTAETAMKKRFISEATRRKMALGQQRRHAAKSPAPDVESKIPAQRTLTGWSAAKKKAQGERMKAYWAAKKKAAKK